MSEAPQIFAQHVRAILDRFLRQNGNSPLPPAEIAGIAQRLWALIEERGLPPPLAIADRGTPGEMSDEQIAAYLERVVQPTPLAWRESVSGPVRQLIKACFYPEFKTCRDSFREVSPDGSCRRQELARTRLRISGAHCVDCPHWVALAPEQHAKFLARQWRSGAAEFIAHQNIFLPEDFRGLRRFLHQRLR
jgi:hypothetical protein